MAYRNLHPDKYSYLLAKGTHEGELKRFFAESKMQLLLKKARVQNLPYGRTDRIRALSDRLPRSTDGIVQNWFQKNITLSEPVSVEEILSDFELYDELNEPIPEERGAQLARSALVHLFADEPSPALMAYLKRTTSQASEAVSTPGDGDKGDDPFEGTEDSHVHATMSPATDGGTSIELADLLAAVISGDETAIDEALAPYKGNTQTLVDVLIASRRGDVTGATSIASTLSPESHEYRVARRVLNQARHLPGSPTAPMSGLRIQVPQPLETLPSGTEFDIVGVCSNEAEKAIFVRPLGLVHDGKVYLLSLEDRVRLFPESGDVMSFKVAGRRLPHRGDIVRWLVAEREDAGGKTRFHYVDEPCPMVEVIGVPFASSAPDEIRHYIKGLMTARTSATVSYPLFALADGVTIAPPKSCDPRRDDAYEPQWQSWRSLNAWLVEGRQFSMGLPQVPASQLDLSPLDSAFKKLVKNIVDEHKVTITKLQIRDLAARIRGYPSSDLSLRAARVAQSLEQVALDAETLEALFPIIVGREEVKRRVDDAVEVQVASRMKERAGLISELESLRNRNEELQRASKSLQSQIKKQEKEVAASVGRAFSRAMEDGFASLAKVEIFRTLSRPNDQPASSMASSVSQELSLHIKRGALTRNEATTRLVALGVSRRRAVGLTLLSQTVGKAGGCLFLRGSDARQIARILGSIESEVTGFIEIPIGLTSSTSMKQALRPANDLETIVVLDADLSAIEAYASPLLDEPFDAITGEASKTARLLFSCLGGDLALPLPHSIRRVSVIIDLDSIWDQQEPRLSDLEEADVLIAKSIYSELIKEVELLEGAERDLLDGVLGGALHVRE